MPKEFSRAGVRLQYPENWTIQTEETESGWTVTFQSKATAFLLLSLETGTDDPARLADETLEAMRKEYPGLESTFAVETVVGFPAVGHDMEFFALDLVNTCWTRCFEGPEGCMMLLGQCTDEELPVNGAVLAAIKQSLVLEDE